MTDIVKLTDLRDDTPIAIPTPGGTIELSVNTVLQWIAPDAPRGEALRFLMVCKAAAVNPFLGEADLVPMGEKWAVVIGKTGLLRKAEDHGQFDGIEAGIICQPYDVKAQRPAGDVIEAEGSFLPDGFRLLGGWARVFRKDRSRPTSARVSVREYARPGPMWQKSTCTMIRKVAIVQALRESGLVSGGWLDQSEVGEPPAKPTAAPAIEVEARLIPMIHGSVYERLEEVVAESGMQPAQVAAMLGRRGAAEIVDLSVRDALELIARLEAIVDNHRAGEILLPDPPATQAKTDDEAASGAAADARFPWESDDDVKAQAEDTVGE